MRGSKRSRGKPLKLYPCFGEMITVKDAADRLNISVNTVRCRLSERGGSMEEVFNFYRGKEEARMEKQEKARTKEQIAAEKIAKMLFDAEDAKAGKIESAEIASASSGPDKIAEAMITPEPELQQPTVPQPAPVGDRKALRTYNRAIRALGELSVIGIGVDELQNRAEGLMEDLIIKRSVAFSRLVDWDKLAAETEDAK